MDFSNYIIYAVRNDSPFRIQKHKVTKKDGLEKTKRMLENVGGKIAGVVLNKVPVNIQKYKSTYYYSSSDVKSARPQNLNAENNTTLNDRIDYEINDNITKDKTDDIIKQLDEYLKQSKNN